jgi:hypothetical protein
MALMEAPSAPSLEHPRSPGRHFSTDAGVAHLPTEAIGDVQVVVRTEPPCVVKTPFAPFCAFRSVQASKPAGL